MEKGYDEMAAARRLEELALDRHRSEHSGMQISRIHSPSACYEAILVGKNWNFVVRDTTEEVVASFQGIIVKKDLPPFTERLGRASAHVKYLRQSVSIGGFKSSTFAKVMDVIASMHAMMGRAVGISNVLDCGMLSTVGDIQVIELSNRYLKPRRGNVTEDEVAFTSHIDPHGYLAKAATVLGLYHSEENAVHYYEREGLDDDSYKYRTVRPLIFSVGDIVEVQASFVMYPLKDGKFKSAMILRGLTLLDGTFTQAQVKHMIIRKLPVSMQSQPVVKRKVGYGDEVLSVTRAKLARMEIDRQVCDEDGEEGHAAEELDVQNFVLGDCGDRQTSSSLD